MSSTKVKETTRLRANVSFAALDPYIESNIVSPKETQVHGKDFIEWGDNNLYPDYLLSLNETVPTLRSIVNGTVDFIVGDNVTILPLHRGFENGQMNGRGDTIAEQVEDLARDYEMYGGFALQIIRGRDGSVAEVYHLPIRFLRANKECDVFYYCEDWQKRGKKDTIVYPAFIPGLKDRWFELDEETRNRHASSVLYVKTDHTHTYPVPVYAASVKACETERMVDEYHLNAIANGFCPSIIINFNNGIPSDQMKEEIERDVDDKFGGPKNAGRVMLSWNPSKDNATTFETPNITDFGEKYKALSETSRERIFTAFRAYPNIFGLSTATGFSIEEFDSAFKLYNRTAVRPVQRMIADAYDKIYNQKGVLNIVPFSLDGQNEQTVN
jgi:hypothetical protein